MTELFLESVRQEWAGFVRVVPRIALGLAVVAIFGLIGRIVAAAVGGVLVRARLTPTHRDFFRTITQWGIALVGLVVALDMVGLEGAAASIVAGGGVTAVVLGFAFRGIGENLLAGLFLAFSRPFEIGDVIESGGFMGQVREIQLRYTHIRAADGRDIYVPSGRIFNESLINYTKDGLRRVSFRIGIDYADDAARGREIVLDALRACAGVLASPEPVALVSSLEASWVELEAAFWVDTFDASRPLGAVRSEAMNRVRETLRENGFVLSTDVVTNVSLALPEPVRVESAPA